MSKLEIIILCIQSIILLGQLLLSRKINNQIMSQEKGYFILEETNCLAHKKIKEKFKDKFVFGKGYNLSFYVSGNTHIILRSEELYIDDVSQKKSNIPYETIFTLDERLKKYVLEINLNDNQLKKDYLDFKLILKLKNCKQYNYIEIITMRFTKDKNKDSENNYYWTLSNYNIGFK